MLDTELNEIMFGRHMIDLSQVRPVDLSGSACLLPAYTVSCVLLVGVERVKKYSCLVTPL